VSDKAKRDRPKPKKEGNDTEKKMKKATHKGHCQVCGAIQKIKNNGSNSLFTHGFTKTNGWWNQNECFGSGHKALEVSNDIIQESIGRAYDKRDKLQEQIVAQEEETADLVVHVLWSDKWDNVHRTRAKVINYEYKVKNYIREGDVHSFSYQAQLPNGEIKLLKLPNKSFKTEAECIKTIREKEILRLSNLIAQIHEYAKHQAEVDNNWSAKPLIEI